MKRRAALGMNRKFFWHHNVEHRQDYIKNEVQWLNLKQETGYYDGWKICTDGQEVSVAVEKSKNG